jgi:hypothetical protein
VIQRNALRSWKLLYPDVDVILFGDEEGAAEVCAEYGLRHEPQVERFQGKLPYVNDMFARAQRMARHEFLCYANCDILFLPDFCDAMVRLRARWGKFLAVGRRWNLDVAQPLDFAQNDWASELRVKALSAKQQQSEWFIDYFAFSRDLFGSDIPPLAVGRAGWDNWMLWKASESGNPVIDVSPSVIAIHQNHDCKHHLGNGGMYSGPEVERNVELAGGWAHLRTIADAKFVLGRDGLRRNYRSECRVVLRGLKRAGRLVYYDAVGPIWFGLLGATRPLRKMMGLRAQSLRRLREKAR